MISSSIRRVALTVHSISKTSKLPGNLSRVVASNNIPSCVPCDQKRASSSKPPSPTNGSKGLVEDRPVASSPTETSSVEAKPLATKNKAKSSTVKNMLRSKNQTTFNIPSVPSTQHITPSLLGPAAFFSLHRPISITNGFPQPVTDEAFASIFTPRTRSSKSQEVILALSSTLDSFNTVTESLDTFNSESHQNQWSELEESDAGKSESLYQSPEIHRLHVNQILGTPQYFMSGKYTPFNPPQPPQPLSIIKTLGTRNTEAQENRPRIYTAVLMVKESIDSNGDVTFTAQHSPLTAEEQYEIPNHPPRRFKTQLAQYRVKKTTQAEKQAISVKRQRKLKMKKHKYKKLMRKTRNLRRRLDRN
ncbi:putative duf1713 domain protein [Erysiphe neolycopersici]|uniref:Small ribosomal subunit protein mS38 n=1 Tax=Erysiphe neolycopersici TaxID=212602 RepID=A0A420HYK6_9PEZI|nr:putative duf1713 domain protein [Erysiphe neolycopersici]